MRASARRGDSCRAGLRLIERNFRCPAGEIDLICDDHGTIVFVEVKTRRTDSAADPEVNIGTTKQAKLAQVARAWLARHGEPQRAYRMDAVSVVMPSRGKAQVRHIREAFVPR
ncbi:MAG: YraN family protein [Phycisphaerae bacterium]